MQEKNNSKVYKKLLASRLFFLFLIPICSALLIGIFQQFYYWYQIGKESNALKTEIANYNKQKEDLCKLIDYYKNESNLANEARVRLNLKKEGENVVIILPAATSTENGEALSLKDIENMPNYQQWWYYFFGK